MNAARLRVSVQHLYEDDRVEVFEGSAVSVRASLLLKYRCVLSRAAALDDVHAVIEQLAMQQIFMVTVTEHVG